MSLSSKRGKRSFPYTDITLCLDAALAAERDSLMREIAKSKVAPSVKKRLNEIENQMRDSLLTVRVTGVPYPEYMKIQRAHPKRNGIPEVFNPETFYSDFVYKTGYEVDGENLTKLSDQPRKDWDEIVGELTTGEMTVLANAVESNNGRPVETGFLSQGSASTEPSPQTSEPLEPGE